jgi:uncharacterized protein DUF4296
MKKVFCLILVMVIASCGEKLLEKPENLIPKGEMIKILKDLTVINSAKNTNIIVLHDYDFEPTSLVFSKYGVDSLQFVASDRYYASLPNEYETIYEALEKLLEEEKNALSDAKKIKDSLDGLKRQETLKNRIKKKTTSKVNDSLQ